MIPVQLRYRQPQRRLQSSYTEGSALELHLLFVQRVWGVVGGDGVHGAIR